MLRPASPRKLPDMVRSATLCLALLVTACDVDTTLDNAVFPKTGDAVVVGMDPSYPSTTALTPYAGAYPGDQNFTLDPASYPVPIGAVGPIDFSLGLPQQPFLCTSEVNGLGQPSVDNHSGWGVPVFNRSEEIAGYSQHCQVHTRAGYYYKPAGSATLEPMPASGAMPADVDFATWAGERVPFVVRVEQGTINRFIYTIAVPADQADVERAHAGDVASSLARPSARRWNRYLIYQFGGGINIGKSQGVATLERVLGWRLNDLQKGYAIVHSTGTETGTHYNMRLAGNTARMVKQQFEALYGAPRKTIGMGASGGAALQYVLAETRPGLLDALIPVYSFPDVATQITWVLDCELLEHYFDVTAGPESRWSEIAQRSLVEGLPGDPERRNVFDTADTVFRLFSFRWPHDRGGATACAIGWRAAIPLVDNPIGFHFKHNFSETVRAATRWSHWHDLKKIYGVGPDGYAYRTFDNVGVQYGLEALRAGHLSMAEFVHLNANVGGWKKPAEQAEPRFWIMQNDREASDFSIWNEHNMTLAADGPIPLASMAPGQTQSFVPAPRASGHIPSMRAAYLAGQVLLGNADPKLPILDVRHYLEPHLDIHHSFASLAARLRLQRSTGGIGNQRIWVAELPVAPSGWFQGIDFEQGSAELNRLLDKALDAMRRWLEQGTDPEDACFDANLQPIAAGQSVWDGPWNERRSGTCTARFPHYRSPRDAAGGNRAGDLFKCHRRPVAQAIASGDYDPVDAEPWRALLETTFPDGVCDYGRPDVGRPAQGLPTGVQREHVRAGGDV